MRTLHSHPLSSYCWKALIALHELGLPFRQNVVDLGDPAHREALARLWPFCAFPVLEEEDGRVVAESSIIVEHLGPGLVPADREAALECRFLDRVFDLSLNDPVGLVVRDVLRPEGSRDPLGVAQARAKMRTAYDVLEARLRGRTWAVGDAFTLADCSAAPALFYASRVERLAHPTVAAYLGRLLERPSVARVVAEAQPYMQHFPIRS